MKGRFRITAIFLACVIVLSGCTSISANDHGASKDDAGQTLEDVQNMSMETQYNRAEEKYEQLNELFNELSAEIHDGTWVDNAGRREIVPGQGTSTGRAPEGGTRDNSYYFTVSRWHESDQDLHTALHRTATSWQDRGWDVNVQSTNISPDSRITARTPDGYWFALDPNTRNQVLELRGNSPVYWGNYLELIAAINERATAEDAAGMPWDTTDRDDETGQANRQPGEYRPFPAWDVIEKTATDSARRPSN